MYGLINKAMQDMVCTQFGVPVWERIKEKAQIDDPVFVGMKPYPDEITYRLANAAHEVLKVPLDQVIEGFGEYWIIYTAEEGYGDLMRLAGNSVKDFLVNLNLLHQRLRNTFPELKPPVITCTDIKEHSLNVHYETERPGLAPMVVGLLKGLGKRFNTPLTVRHTTKKSEGAPHDIFEVLF
jgi:hypothetical protein